MPVALVTPRPTPEQIGNMHHQAHAECFIANSVRTEVVTEMVIAG